jgi:acetolactate synthase regulatory subunit
MTNSTKDHQHLTLRVDATPHALARITAVCARRRLEVVELGYRLGPGGTAVVDLAIAGPVRTSERAQAWLERLVEVLSVELSGGARRPRRTRARTRPVFSRR